LGQRKPRVVEKGTASSSQLHATRATTQQLDPNLILQIADLPAQRRLRSMQAPFGRQRQAARLGDRDEVSKMTQLHSSSLLTHAFKACVPAYKVFFKVATDL
jgi:hypothetical protein